MDLHRCRFNEKSGIAVDALGGKIALDSTKLLLQRFYFKTPHSYLRAKVSLDLKTFAKDNSGKFNVSLNGKIGKPDLMHFMSKMPSTFIKQWPNRSLTISGTAIGNMQAVCFSSLSVNLPTAFNIKAKGFVANLDKIKKLRGSINLRAHAYKMGFAMSMLPKNITKKIRIPSGIYTEGNIKFNGNRYSANLIAKDGKGRLSAVGDFNADRKS